MFKWLICLCSCFYLYSDNDFKGLVGRPLDFISVFLPSAPLIFATPGYEVELFSQWPTSQIIHDSKQISMGVDLFRIHLDGPDNWETLPLFDAKVIYLDAIVYPFSGTPQFLALKKRLEQLDFSLLMQWSHEAAQMSFIFVQNECFYSRETANYLTRNATRSNSYQVYDSCYFCCRADVYGWVRFCVDDDLEDTIKGVLRSGFPYEGNLSIMIHELTKPNSVAIDVGAHVGVHTVFMSRKAGPRGAVVSFEPNKKLYMEHLANMDLNQCCNVIAIAKGLGHCFTKAYQRKIEIEQNDSSCCLCVDGEGDFIDIVPLDAYQINDISLIKIDVENYEYFVLQGAKETILRSKPVIFFECWIGYDYDVRDEVSQRKNFKRVMALLDSYGYDVHVLYNCDFLAIPKETTDALLLKYKRKYKKIDVATYIN